MEPVENKALTLTELRAEIAKLPYGRKCKILEMLAKEVSSGKKGGVKGISIKEIVKVFSDYAAFELGRATNTVDSYRYDLNIFAEFCEQQNIGEWGVVDVGVVQRFVVHQSKRGLKASSINRSIACIKGLVRCSMQKGFLFDERILSVPRQKLPFRINKEYSFEDFEQMVQKAKAKNKKYTLSFLGLRDAAIFEFLYGSGCRVAEARDLMIGDIDFEQMTARITGKGNKQRLAILNKICIKTMCDYLQKGRPVLVKPIRGLGHRKTQRKDRVLPGRQHFFLSRTGVQLGTREFRRIIKRHAEKLGFPELSPHQLRHMCAQHCFNSGMSLSDIQQMLGHVSIDTTTTYAHSSPKRLKEKVRQFHPRAAGE